MCDALLEQEILLCRLGDLAEQQTMELLVQGRQLFAIRLENRIHAYWNTCPHMGIPLNWVPNRFLDFDKAFIQCSSHGALFEVATGKCIAGPCLGDSLGSVDLRRDNDHYYICANQPLPEIPPNLRALALADLEDKE